MRSLVLALTAVATLAAAPAFAAPPATASMTTTKTATPMATTTTKTKSTAPSKMKACGGQWTAMSAADKGKYNDKAKTMKSKSGGKLSGYNVWTGECMKKA